MIRFGIRSCTTGFYKGNYDTRKKVIVLHNVTRTFATEIQKVIFTGISPASPPKDIFFFWKKKNKGGTSPKPKQSCPTPACPPPCSRSSLSNPPSCNPPRTCPPPCPAPSPCCPPPCPPKPCPCPPKPSCPPPCPPRPCPCPPRPCCPPPPCPPRPCPCPPKSSCLPPPKPPCATTSPKPACPPPCPPQKAIKPPCQTRKPPPTPKPHPCPPPPKPSAHPPIPCCPPPKAASCSHSKSNSTPACLMIKKDNSSAPVNDTSSKDRCIIPCNLTAEVFSKRLSILDLPKEKLPDICPNAFNESNNIMEQRCPPQCNSTSCPQPRCPY